MNSILKRALSILLVFVMCISMLPASALAEGGFDEADEYLGDDFPETTPEPTYTIRITAHPQSVEISEGGSFELSVGAEFITSYEQGGDNVRYDNLTYLWKYINPFTQEWEDADCFSTAYDSNVFRIDNVTTDMNGYQFMCIVSVPGMEPVESEIATIIVNDSPETTVDSGTCGENLTWELDSDGVLTISGSGVQWDYETEHATPWSDYKDSIYSVIISDNVINIGYNAFCGCTNLNSVEIGNSVTSIGRCAFQNCSGLTSINIPDSVKTIDNNAFLSCASLTGVEIPNGVTVIGDAAFYGCGSLTSIEIPDSVTSIGSMAFFRCTDLINIKIGDGVTSIGNAVFSYCANLQNITVSDDNNAYSSVNGVLFNNDKTVLIFCPDGKSGTYAIPDSVTSIGSGAFQNCVALTSIEIPDSVISIGTGAFSNCTGLSIIEIPDSVTDIGRYSFENCSGLLTVIIGISVTSIGEKAFESCNSLTDVYYSGTQTQWNAITIGTGNECLTNATIQYAPSSGYSLPTNVRWEPFGTVKFTVPDDVWAVKDEIYYSVVLYIDGKPYYTDTSGNQYRYGINFGAVTAKEMEVYADVGPYPAFNTYSGNYKARVFFCAKSDFLSIYPGSETETVSFTVPEESLPAPSNLAKNDNIISWPEIDGTIKYFYYWSNGSGLSGGCYTADNYIDLEDFESKGISITSLELIALSDNPMDIASSGYSQWFTVDELPEGDYRESPAITSQPESCTVDAGESATLSVTAAYSGSGELTYLWKSYNKYTKQWEDANDFNTAYTNSTFTVNDVTTYMNDYTFKCIITAPNGTSVETDEVTITVNDNTVASGTCGDNLTWELDSDGVLTISGSGDMADLSNPSDAPWYSYKDEIKSVSILDGVTSIGRFAFFYCSNLTSISLSDTVSTINGGAIYWCENLAEITVAENNASFTSVDGVLFNRQMTELVRCPGGKSGVYSIPDSVVNISASAFFTCYKLTGVNIPDGVKTIGPGAFEYCSGLTQVNIPYGVTCISNYAFESCSNLTSVIIPDSVVTIGQFAFQCSGLKSISICSGITSIGMNAFNSTSLTNVYYNGSQTQWDAIEIASGNDSLINAAIQFTADNIEITYQPVSCTVNEGDTATLTVSAEYSGSGELTYLWKSYNKYTEQWEDANDFATSYNASTFTVNDVTMYMNDYKFKCIITAPNGTSVETDEVTITVNDNTVASGTCGDNLTWTLNEAGLLTISGTGNMAEVSNPYDIPWYSYENQIKSVIISNGVNGIGRFAFWQCDNLTSISLSDTVSQIDGGAIFSCSNLTEITVSDSNENFTSEYGVLFNEQKTILVRCPCGKSGSYTVPVSVTYIADGAFDSCSKLTDVIINDGVTGIGAGAFEYCSSLTSISIPDSVTGTLNYTFQYCTSLTSIEISDNITGIGTFAFCGCSSLTEISIPDSVTNIGQSAFALCSGLKSVDIPDSVTEVGAEAFCICTGLTNVAIGSGIAVIGDNAFTCCSSLNAINVSEYNEHYSTDKGVLFNTQNKTLVCYPGGKSGTYNIPNGVEYIQNGAFNECKGLTGITFPNTMISIGEAAFYLCGGLTDITIPASVSSIGKVAFGECNSLKNIVFEHDSTDTLAIESYAFSTSTRDSLTTVKVQDTNLKNSAISDYDWAGSNRTVTYQEIEKITITSQPVSCTVDAGGSATLSVTAEYSGSGELSYLWKSYNKYTKQWEDANDFATSYTASTFTVNDVTMYMNDYKFKCIITAPNGTSVETDVVTITVTEVPVASTATLTVSSGTLRPGKTVSLSVSLSENSNAKMMQFTVLYDSAKLKLESCEAGAGMSGLSPTINTNTAGKIVFAWESTKAYTGSGSLMDMTFSVADGVTSGTADIKVDTSSKFIFRESLEKSIDVEVIDGAVSIYAWDMGDANMDDSIDIIDCSLIRHYAAGLKELSDEQKTLADVNGDGKVNVIDVNLVRRYVAELITSFPVSV